MQLTICHLYPDLLNLYGDRGNVLSLATRCRWHGITVQVKRVSLKETLNPDTADLYFIGGGQDREQEFVAEDLSNNKSAPLKEAVAKGAVVLAICGGYQLLGKYYTTGTGQQLPGIGILDAWTDAGHTRHIDNVVVETDFLKPSTLVGFENHSGRTRLGSGCRPLARVVFGAGNNGEDGTEGARYRNVFGTYLHGSLLPKNPHFADYLLLQALKIRYPSLNTFTQLDDGFEFTAHRSMVKHLTGKDPMVAAN